MEPINNLVGQVEQRLAEPSTDRKTERGELMEYFCSRLNPSRKKAGYAPVSMARMGRMLEGIPTKDLYYIKSICDNARNFSKQFWYELDYKKHKDFTHRV